MVPHHTAMVCIRYGNMDGGEGPAVQRAVLKDYGARRDLLAANPAAHPLRRATMAEVLNPKPQTENHPGSMARDQILHVGQLTTKTVRRKTKEQRQRFEFRV